MPDGLQEEIETEVGKGRYKNKSELVRDAVRRLLEERQEVDSKPLSREALEEIREARQSEEKTYTLEEAKEKLGVAQ